ncbi:CpaE family protein [Aquipuribacter hungaricus]|uniref:AAA family ATPase n=1 Tax=Aquipuribacter hungaricus TaxID=545624 RepID=UPI003623158C
MSPAPGRGQGPVAVVTAVSGPVESSVAVALSGRRDLALVRRCADVAELLSVAEVGLASVAVVNEAFTGLDADVVDRLRRSGLAVLGVVDPDRESSERLRAWQVPVVEVAVGPGSADGAREESLALAVVAAGDGGARRRGGDHGGGTGDPGGTAGGPGGAVGPGDADLGGPGHGGAGRRGAEVDAAGGTDVPAGRRGPGTDLGGPDGPGETGGPGGPVRPGGPDGPVGGGDGHGPGGDPGGEPGDGQDPGRPVGADPADDGPGARDLAVRAAGSRGRVVAVWGPPGAPGRTTVAVGVAAELADAGQEVLLVDADTYAASVAQVLGLLDESPGLVAAVRAGLEGRLDPPLLARLAPVAAPRLRVLTGLTRAARWSELRPAGLEAVLDTGCRLVDVVVVDLAPPLEEDEELSYDTAAPRRNGAALDVLRAADDVLVVGSADPVGLQRLVRGLQDLAAAVPSAAPVVVVNRVRADAVGRGPAVRVAEALRRFAGVEVRHLVPDDRPATDRALLSGRTLLEQSPGSPARAALRTLAVSLLPAGAPAAGRAAGRRAVRRRGWGARAGRPAPSAAAAAGG